MFENRSSDDNWLFARRVLVQGLRRSGRIFVQSGSFSLNGDVLVGLISGKFSRAESFCQVVHHGSNTCIDRLILDDVRRQLEKVTSVIVDIDCEKFTSEKTVEAEMTRQLMSSELPSTVKDVLKHEQNDLVKLQRLKAIPQRLNILIILRRCESVLLGRVGADDGDAVGLEQSLLYTMADLGDSQPRVGIKESKTPSVQLGFLMCVGSQGFEEHVRPKVQSRIGASSFNFPISIAYEDFVEFCERWLRYCQQLGDRHADGGLNLHLLNQAAQHICDATTESIFAISKDISVSAPIALSRFQAGIAEMIKATPYGRCEPQDNYWSAVSACPLYPFDVETDEGTLSEPAPPNGLTTPLTVGKGSKRKSPLFGIEGSGEKRRKSVSEAATPCWGMDDEMPCPSNTGFRATPGKQTMLQTPTPARATPRLGAHVSALRLALNGIRPSRQDQPVTAALRLRALAWQGLPLIDHCLLVAFASMLMNNQQRFICGRHLLQRGQPRNIATVNVTARKFTDMSMIRSLECLLARRILLRSPAQIYCELPKQEQEFVESLKKSSPGFPEVVFVPLVFPHCQEYVSFLESTPDYCVPKWLRLSNKMAP